jgi:hypothetical protein
MYVKSHIVQGKITLDELQKLDHVISLTVRLASDARRSQWLPLRWANLEAITAHVNATGVV